MSQRTQLLIGVALLAACASGKVQGSGGGTIGCVPACVTGFTCDAATHTCVAAAVCGNGLVEAGEQCDGANLSSQTCALRGFSGGTLACSAACAFDTSACTGATCGNGVIEPGEQCDGAALAGRTCASFGMGGSGLACKADCSGFDTSACTPAAGAVFPLAISASKNGLVDASGNPFLMQGDAAWSIIAELGDADTLLYLDDRQAKGFNTLLVNLVEHQFTNHSPSPRNAAGDLPFTNLNDLSTTNDAYFAHADWFLAQALARGMLVLLAPAYMGWSGTNDGWIKEMKSSGTTKLGLYGQYLGTRYRNQTNIIWVNGGDYTPAGSTEMGLVAAIIGGIKAASDTHLHVPHWGGYSTYPGEGYTPHQSWIDVDTIYYTAPPNISNYADPGWLADRGVRPVFFIEGNYENEHNTTPREVRSQMYQPLLAGEVGFVMGVGTVWNFWSSTQGGTTGNVYSNDNKYPQGWKQALASPGALHAQLARAFFAALPWASLVPDGGNTAGAAVQRSWAADGGTGVAYTLSTASFGMDMTKMKGSTRAQWFDPSSGAYATVSGSPFPNTGSRSFTPPGSTADGSTDWLLLLQSP